MKYEIIKNGIDDYILKYKNEEIKLKSTIDIATKMQNVNKLARIKMIQDLGQSGMTINELVKEIKKDGKTYYDNSNKEELEKVYIQEEQGKVFIETVEEMTGKKFTDLITEIGIETEEEVKIFGEQIGEVIAGTFPSKQKKD